ncbi:MAG: hypothetical protein AAB408_03200 [Patescibacteria group bacterium]
MDEERSREVGPQPLDISERVRATLYGDSTRKAIDLMRLMRSEDILQAPALTLTLDYTNLNHAKWVKSFVSSGPPEQKRTASIRATESQAKEAANIFASGVEWVKI